MAVQTIPADSNVSSGARCGLNVHAYDDPRLLWQDMLDEWQQSPDAALVFVSTAAKDRFVRQATETLWDDRVLTVGDLWADVARAAKLVRVSPARPGELRAALRGVLADPSVSVPDSMRQLTAAGLDALARHLADIEMRAPDTYAPQTETEHGVQAVRKALRARRVATRAGYWAEVSQNAHRVSLGRKVIFAPSGQLSPHIARLMRGLAARQPVTSYMLTSQSQLPASLRISQLDGHANIIARFTRTTAAAQLFTGTAARPVGQTVMWAQSADENETAVNAACEMIDDGLRPSEIVIVHPNPVAEASEIARHAAAAGLKIRVSRRFTATDTPIGATLLALARLNPHPGCAHELLAGDGARAGLTVEDIEKWDAARPGGVIAQLEALLDIGWSLLERANTNVNYTIAVHGFLTGLAEDLHAYTLSGLQPAAPVEALLDASSALTPVGAPDGVAVVRYDEAAGCQAKAAVLCGLHADGWPGRQERSPFLSAQQAAACPALDAVDPRPEFVSAVAAASERLVFTRRDADRDEPGTLWQETRRLAVHAHTQQRAWPRPRSRQRILQQLAAAGALPEDLAELRDRASRERLPRGALEGNRTTYSVTELEQYITCPYGWFVQYVLAPARQPTPAAQLGTLQHAILDASLTVPFPDRENLIRAQVQAAADSGQLTRAQAATVLQRLLTVNRRYGGADWPFHRQRQEVRLAATLFGEYRITGRADRADFTDSGVLIVDYKNRRAPRRKPASERVRELQRYLYPHLAARTFDVSPLGTIYVSLFHGAHDGSLAHPIPGVSNDATDHEFQPDSEKALSAVRDAISRIEAGEWSQIGTRCGEWCAHRLLSRTVEHP